MSSLGRYLAVQAQARFYFKKTVVVQLVDVFFSLSLLFFLNTTFSQGYSENVSEG